jgi:hypothetical protein
VNSILRRPVLYAILAAAFLSVLLARPEASQRISIQNVNATTRVVRIDEPTVTQRLTEYRDIVFQPGDVITVNAGGCVQTGGHGSTWKRYVNPSGANADRLYHGLIWIPGVMGGLARIQGWMGRPLVVPQNVAGPAFLRLGYEDDGFGDNGYYSHDDGTDNQCKGSGGGAAWITLTIVHNIITTPPPVAKPQPFDVISADFDENGIPLNPRWGSQVPAPGVLPSPGMCGQEWLPPCTNQAPGIDKYWLCSDSGSLGGHANWTPATYEGTALWNSHSTPGTDDDYNIDLVPNTGGGLTEDNPVVLHTEFDSDETIDHFTTSWWKGFHDAVDASDAAARSVIDGRSAVIMGLLGLDCAHACGSELHPVWVLALRVSDSSNDEAWAFMVRNWGNEGFCGDQEHYLDVSTIRVRLPWRPGASAVSLKSAEFLTNSTEVTGPSLEPAPNQGVSVVFTLPAPESHARVNGILHLTWTGTTVAARPQVAVNVADLRARVQRQKVHDGVEPEDKHAALLAKMAAPDRQRLLASVPAKSKDRDGIALKSAMKPATGPHAIPSSRPRTRAVPNDPVANTQRQRKDVIGRVLTGRTR